jgi:hypothetical protein
MHQMKEMITQYQCSAVYANGQPLLESATGLNDKLLGYLGSCSDWLCSSPNVVGVDGRVLRTDLINTRMIFAYQSRKGEG